MRRDYPCTTSSNDPRVVRLGQNVRTEVVPPRRSEEQVGQLGLALFRRLGVDAYIEPRAHPRLVERLLPEISGMSYVGLLNSVFQHGGRRSEAITESDESQWLAGHLCLEALGELDQADPLHAIWTRACDAAGIGPREAQVDPRALEQELAELSFGPDSDELLAFALSRTLRRRERRCLSC